MMISYLTPMRHLHFCSAFENVYGLYVTSVMQVCVYMHESFHPPSFV